MSKAQTDNSNLSDKVYLRTEAIKKKKSITVLDAYHGTGAIWQEVNNRHNGKIKVIGIEKENGKGSGSVIYGDNLKLLGKLDLSEYDVIDLDAYGIPAMQLQKVLYNPTLNKGTIIFYTCIGTMQGRIPNTLLKRLGYTKDMIDKAPTLFSRNLFGKFCNYLSTFGIKKVYNIGKTSKKHYGYFTI